MAQIYESQPDPLYSGLATGLSGALQQLAQRKITQNQKNQQASGLATLLGIPLEQALQVINTPESIQKEYAKQKFAQPGNEALVNLLNKTYGLGSEQSNQEPEAGSISNPITPADVKGVKTKDLVNILEKGEERKLKREKLDILNSKEAREFSKPYQERAEKSKANIRDYKAAIKIAERGDIRAGNKQIILQKLGLEDIGRSTDTQIAQKLFARLAQNVAGVFGSNSRVTNFLEQTFQRSIPSLMNSPEGIIKISKINMLADEANLLVNDERQKLLKETKGKIPYNADDIIRERVRPQLEDFENQAVNLMSGEDEKSPQQSTGLTANTIEQARQMGATKVRNKQTGEIIDLTAMPEQQMQGGLTSLLGSVTGNYQG